MPRALLALILAFAVALPCHAQGDKPKPNTLTPKEIADGWILLFDGETTFGWNAGAASADGGALVIGGPQESKAAVHAVFCNECEVVFEYRGNGGFGTASRSPDDKGGFFAAPGLRSEEWDTRRLLFHATDAKSPSNRSGTHVEYFYGGGKAGGGSWMEGLIAGTHKVYFLTGPGERLELRNIKARCGIVQPLFNGTDLTGWKAFPGEKYKSKFTVADGAIHVKNGPGDLQTVGKYKDFVLQLECKSNGPHLNSGIFFRCRDNEYQNGYECQIRNQFHEKPDQKYMIEEYDPKTNKLIGKKEQFFTAVDYGTGAIYRRQPARKEMAKDGEWFTMTIVAHGNHLATWVNGVQVTDWTDNRPKSDNARTGCKLDAGHISIQGHDPTTDLSFRNIRIAEFK